jgi:uncharacterized protein
MSASVREITSATELRELLGEPTPRSLVKERPRLHARDRDWLAASPFCLIATAGAEGNCDISPKGDPPGFTLVLDDSTIAIPSASATGAPMASIISCAIRTSGSST